MVANLRVCEATSLRELTTTSPPSEQEALRQRAWAILVPVHALLLRRLADNTLLPGTIEEEEVTYNKRVQAFIRKMNGKPVISEALLQLLGGVLGYATLLQAVSTTMVLLVELRINGLPRERAHSFVLTALDAIPRSATTRNRLTGVVVHVGSEATLVMVIELNRTHRTTSPPFAPPCF